MNDVEHQESYMQCDYFHRTIDDLTFVWVNIVQQIFAGYLVKIILKHKISETEKHKRETSKLCGKYGQNYDNHVLH